MMDIKRKLVVAGDVAVGKTSLIRRFVLNTFDESYISTLGTRVSKKVMEVDGVNVISQVWDVSGQIEMQTIQQTSFRGAHGALIVGDLSRPETIKHIRYWVAFITRIAGPIPVILLGNKSDLVPTTVAEREALEALGAIYGATTWVTSALSGDGVEESFFQLSRESLSGRERQYPVTEEDAVPVAALDPLLQAEDRMVTAFCKAMNDTDLGMSIVRRQFDRSDIDFRTPTPTGINRVAKKLIDVGRTMMDRENLQWFEEQAENIAKELRALEENQ